MTQAEAQILELFQTLGTAERARLAEQLYEESRLDDFVTRMTPEQRAHLQEGIDQADRGEMLSPEELRANMAKRFGLPMK